MKFEVILIQVKSIAIEVEAKNSDAAVYNAKKATEVTPKYSFDNRLGEICIAGVRELENANNSDNT